MKKEPINYITPDCDEYILKEGANLCITGSNEDMIGGGDENDIYW